MIKRFINIFKKLPVLISGLSLLSTLGFATVANAVSPAAANTGASASNVQTIITKGDTEIARRLTSLNKLNGLIASSTKISSIDKTTLTAEVLNSINGLGTDKTTLDSATTVSAAHIAALSIVNDYRVYALVVPQVYIIKTADRQQQVETKLSSLAANLTTALASSTSSNATLTADLASMKTNITNANQLSVSVENSVIALNPSDYNADHTLLQQYYASLKTALADNQQSYTLAKMIITALKTK